MGDGSCPMHVWVLVFRDEFWDRSSVPKNGTASVRVYFISAVCVFTLCKVCVFRGHRFGDASAVPKGGSFFSPGNESVRVCIFVSVVCISLPGSPCDMRHDFWPLA